MQSMFLLSWFDYKERVSVAEAEIRVAAITHFCNFAYQFYNLFDRCLWIETKKLLTHKGIRHQVICRHAIPFLWSCFAVNVKVLTFVWFPLPNEEMFGLLSAICCFPSQRVYIRSLMMGRWVYQSLFAETSCRCCKQQGSKVLVAGA